MRDYRIMLDSECFGDARAGVQRKFRLGVRLFQAMHSRLAGLGSARRAARIGVASVAAWPVVGLSGETVASFASAAVTALPERVRSLVPHLERSVTASAMNDSGADEGRSPLRLPASRPDPHRRGEVVRDQELHTPLQTGVIAGERDGLAGRLSGGILEARARLAPPPSRIANGDDVVVHKTARRKPRGISHWTDESETFTPMVGRLAGA